MGHLVKHLVKDLVKYFVKDLVKQDGQLEVEPAAAEGGDSRDTGAGPVGKSGPCAAAGTAGCRRRRGSAPGRWSASTPGSSGSTSRRRATSPGPSSPPHVPPATAAVVPPREDFLRIPELAINPIGDRIVHRCTTCYLLDAARCGLLAVFCNEYHLKASCQRSPSFFKESRGSGGDREDTVDFRDFLRVLAHFRPIK